MRNLKKFLALVMAMVMTFSLMLTVNAANTAKDFDDADQITEAFVEAADVLTGMKVFQGDEEAATFRPADQINRAEVAALIYRLATGDVDDVRSGAYANYGNFTDVNESDWFAGYVGYCANAGYIKGHDGYFNPYDPVTGYETLAMILRAIGYDKNNEFTGSTWETNVSALATQLGILTNIKTTHYGNTLYLASRRDVVAELLFQADAKVPMVVYTPAFGYQQTGMSGGVVGSTTNPTLGKHIFGLTLSEDGILLGNQQTGETGSVLGYAGEVSTDKDGAAIKPYKYSAYAWNGTYDVTDMEKVDSTQPGGYATAGAGKIKVSSNVKYELETGIDLIGHKLKLWYDDGSGVVSGTKKHVFAYFDEVKLTEVVAVQGATADGTMPTNPTAVNATASNYSDGGRNLYDLIEGAGFKAPTDKTEAVFNNSFGLFGTDFSDNANKGNGVPVDEADAIESPVRLYKLISNSSNKQLDAVIALNIESSRITESNTVNRVPTIGVPVSNAGAVNGGTTPADIAKDAQLQTKFIDTDNVTPVNTVPTGVIAQAALVGNSTKTLGNYEFGIHITGTTIRDPKEAEKIAVKNTNTNASLTETAYFLMNQVTAPVEGTVVAYNVSKGTVTLDNGTVLERSKYYHTVVGWAEHDSSANGPSSVIPQAWMNNGTEWIEGYANVGYKFYLDHEGKYLGAERTYGSTFLYGTYLDYDQKVSSSTFNYYLTGVNLDGEIETKQVSKYWDPTAVAAASKVKDITGTDLLGVPYRDTSGGTGSTTTVNGIGDGVYKGFAITGDTVDEMTTDPGTNKNEYLNNMARLGIFVGDGNGVEADTVIDSESITLGAEVVGSTPGAGTNKYFTEATKFILVSGYGTDSVKAEVYNGISALKGTSSSVILALGQTSVKSGSMSSIDATDFDKMTYFQQSNYTYAQSGDTDKKIDTIILPKAAVTWTGGSSLYYVGDNTPTLVNSWGTDAWKYNLYMDGELRQVWLTNDPNEDNGGSAPTKGSANDAYNLTVDTFLSLYDTGEKANDGQPIYTAGSYDATDGVFTGGLYLTNNDTTTLLPAANGVTYLTGATYSAITRDAQTATFDATQKKLLNVASAKVVNLNAEANCVTRPSSGYIWPGITDLTTLNQAGSINPVTGRALKVSAMVDASNPLIVTCIYVCYEQ